MSTLNKSSQTLEIEEPLEKSNCNDGFKYRMKLVKKIIKFLMQTPLNIFYFLSAIFPKDMNLWLVGTSMAEGFRDNAKYFFLQAVNVVPNDVKVVWISKDKEILSQLREHNFNCVHLWSLKGIYYSLRAGVIIYDHSLLSVNRFFSHPKITVNLWHGLPLKRIEWDIKLKKHRMYRLTQAKGIEKLIYRIVFPHVYAKHDFVLITSEFFKDIFKRAFKVDDDGLLYGGYPRNDIFVSPIKGYDIGVDLNALKLINDLSLKGEKIIVYLPTFRDTCDLDIDKILDMEKLNKLMQELNAHFFLKLHPYASESFKKIISELENTNRIHFIDPKSDVYPLLKYIDILITDYSSIFFDFLYLDRPIIFYAFDLHKYRSSDRELYFDYTNFVPGPVTSNFEELTGLLEKYLTSNNDNKDEYAEKRKELLVKCYNGFHPISTPNLVMKLLKKIYSKH